MNNKIPVILIVIFFLGALALGDTVANLVSLTIGFGFNNNGTTITTTGNLSINDSVIQRRLTGCAGGYAAQGFAQNGVTTCTALPSGVYVNVSLVCATDFVLLVDKFQNFTYENGILISNSSCS